MIHSYRDLLYTKMVLDLYIGILLHSFANINRYVILIVYVSMKGTSWLDPVGSQLCGILVPGVCIAFFAINLTIFWCSGVWTLIFHFNFCCCFSLSAHRGFSGDQSKKVIAGDQKENCPSLWSWTWWAQKVVYQKRWFFPFDFPSCP